MIPPEPMVDFLLRLLNTPSPSGFTEGAVALIESELSALGVSARRTRKGALHWTLPGTDPVAGHIGPRHLALSAHTDTLGAMIRAILPDGRLRLTQLGGYDWTTIEGAYVNVHPQSGKAFTGTVVNDFQSGHIRQGGSELRRSGENLYVRLDEVIGSSHDVRALGIEVGDFVSFEPRAVLTPSGYLKSRHLDNKAGVAILLEVTRQLVDRPAPITVSGWITVHEEVGHGAAPGFADADELIVLDMAVVAAGQTSDERQATLCVKDSSGPYDHALSNRLRAAARRAGVALNIDTYPRYSSDASAAWSAGADLSAALIGPGVDASHAYERTHVSALQDCVSILTNYCREPEAAPAHS